MRKIIFIEPQTQVWKDWRNKCEKETEILVKAFRENGECTITSLYKKRDIKKNV